MKLRNRAFGHLGAVAAMSALAAACTSPTPAPAEPTPTPTQSSPAASSTPPETQLERQTRLDFEAAEKAYRTSMMEQDRVFGAGRARHPSEALKNTSTGKYLSYISGDLAAAAAEGWHTSAPTKIVAVHHERHSQGRVILTSCEDNRNVLLIYQNGRKERPKGTRLYVQNLTVRRIDGRWKVADIASDQVKTFVKEPRCSA